MRAKKQKPVKRRLPALDGVRAASMRGSKPKPEWRMERNCPSRLMGVIEGYAIVRRKGCVPYCVSVKVWENLPVVEG